LASSLLDELGEGILIPMHQSIGHLTAPCKALEVDILNHLNQHNNNPIQRWMFSNTILKIDHNGNQKPNKEKSKNKIDGVVAEVMAKGAQLHHEANDKPNQWFAPIEFN
jgi:phage terminase large subunit-like protein